MVAAAAFALDEDLPPILAERRPGMGAGRDGSSFHRLAFRSVIRIVLPDPNPQHAASGYETAKTLRKDPNTSNAQLMDPNHFL